MEKNKKIKRLPLNSDIVFKRVFGKEENKDLLKSLLESILCVKIKNLVVRNPEIARDLQDSKAGALDVKVTINDNTVCDVEMQVGNEANINNRSVYYMVKMAANELKISEEYNTQKKTIVINFLNFDFFKRNSYHNIAHMKFEKSSKEAYIDLGYKKEDELVTDVLEMHFIELKKFKKKNPDTSKTSNQWLWLIIGEEEKIRMTEKENKQIKKAIEILDEMSMDPKEWELYDSRERAIVNYNSGILNAEERGMKKGKKEGIKEGIKEGKRREKEETAKKLLELDVEIEKIMKATGLSEEDIKKLKD